jgi:hypothetical protein
VSFLSFANPEKGDPNSGMFILLAWICELKQPENNPISLKTL